MQDARRQGRIAGNTPHGHTKKTGSLTNPIFFLIGYGVLARDREPKQAMTI